MLGLALDADAVGPQTERAVPTNDRPHDADGEDQAGAVTDEGVGPIHVAVKELEVGGDLVVDLKHGGHAEQDDEPEVDHRVHDPSAWFAQQRLHVHAGPEIPDAGLGVFERRATVVGASSLPILDAVGREPRSVDQQHRDDGVERQL